MYQQRLTTLSVNPMVKYLHNNIGCLNHILTKLCSFITNLLTLKDGQILRKAIFCQPRMYEIHFAFLAKP